METIPGILPILISANRDKFMGTITQKFVIVFLTIVFLMVMNVILQQSEFTASYFGKSPSQGRVLVTGTDSTFSPSVPSDGASIEWSVSKPFQNEENGENVLGDSEGENQTFTPLTHSAPQSEGENDLVLAQDFSKKMKKICKRIFRMIICWIPGKSFSPTL